MKDHSAKTIDLEKTLSALLYYGTWVASAVTAVGYFFRSYTNEIIIVGIALFILLPTLRVMLLLFIFVRRHEYNFGLVAALVLAIIIASTVIGLYLPQV